MNAQERIFVGLKLPADYIDAVSRLYSDSNDKRLKNCKWVSSDSMHLTLTFIGEVSSEERQSIQRALEGVQFCPFHLQVQNLVETFPAKAKKNIRVLHMPIYAALPQSDQNEMKSPEFFSGPSNRLSEELNNLKNSVDGVLETLNCNTVEESNEMETNPIAQDPTAKPGDTNNNNRNNHNNNIKKNEKKKNRKEVFHPHLTLSRVRQHPRVHEILDWLQDTNLALQDVTNVDYPIWSNMIFPVNAFILFRSHLTPKGSLYEVIQEYPASPLLSTRTVSIPMELQTPQLTSSILVEDIISDSVITTDLGTERSQIQQQFIASQKKS
jgi:2'-5' RNA ligase